MRANKKVYRRLSWVNYTTSYRSVSRVPSPICNPSRMLGAWQRAWAGIAGTNHIPPQISLALKGENVWKSLCSFCSLGKRKTHSTKTPENPKPNHTIDQIHTPATLKGLHSEVHGTTPMTRLGWLWRAACVCVCVYTNKHVLGRNCSFWGCHRAAVVAPWFLEVSKARLVIRVFKAQKK